MEQKGEERDDGRCVLVVEDDCAIRGLLATIVEAELGARVLEATDGAEALEILNEANPALVVTDVRMPEVDGFELLRRLRRSTATRRLPVLVVTAAASSPGEVLAAGADDYLAKPFDIDALITKICCYLGCA